MSGEQASQEKDGKTFRTASQGAEDREKAEKMSEQQVRRMISVEVEVADEEAGEKVASLMMGASSLMLGRQRAVTDGSVLKYLRALSASESAGRAEPGVWVDFGITYDNNAEANPIADWLFNTSTSRTGSRGPAGGYVENPAQGGSHGGADPRQGKEVARG